MNAILFINVGTPNSSKTKDVRIFLREFLGDKRVISIPYLFRKLLVNFIIAPFRAPKSAKLYQQLWTKKGSPLLLHSLQFKDQLKNILPDNYQVFIAMRYGKPDLGNEINKILQKKFDKITVIPLFPQFASSTSGTAIEYVLNQLKKQETLPDIEIKSFFYHQDFFINSFVNNIKKYDYNSYDKIIFSYHGLPLKQVYAMHNSETCDKLGCTKNISEENKICYHAQCYETTKLIVKKLKLAEKKYVTSFQSRFAKKWLSPFTDKLIEKYAKEGIKRVLVVCPAFVVDCLETTVEIGYEYKQLFIKNGGEELQLVESLNSDNYWIENFNKFIKNNFNL